MQKKITYIIVVVFLIGAASTLAFPHTKRDTDSKIKNVVLLVLENRSFSKIAGYFNYSKEIRGLTGNEYNLVNTSDLNSTKIYATKDAVYVDPLDPGHEMTDVFEQITGHPGSPLTKINGTPPMSGFVQNFKTNNKLNAADVASLKHVINAYNPDDIPVVHTLAQNFALIDGWFASIPGSTTPNRLFVHSATSNGETQTNAVSMVLGYPQKTIYNSFEEHNVTWKHYYSILPTGLVFQQLRKRLQNFQKLDLFYKDAAAGKLPQFSFVEPAYVGIPCFAQNDEHPPSDVSLGEIFVKSIYEALRASPQWKQSLLIITWDEHGGFYDNFPTPLNIPPPDDKRSSDFNFDRLGVRVPTLLISPWIEKGTVIHTPINPNKNTFFEHSSIPATMKKIFNLPNFLTKRDEWAGTFETAWETLTAPRNDTPTTLPTPPATTPARQKSSNSSNNPPTLSFTDIVCDGLRNILA